MSRATASYLTLALLFFFSNTVAEPFSSSSGAWFPFSALTPSFSSSFDNMFSQSQSLSTVSEFKNVSCKKAVPEGDELKNIKFGTLEIEERLLQEISELIKQIDNIQHDLCRQMISDGRSTSFVIMVGQERNEILRFGKKAELYLSNAKSSNSVADSLSKIKTELYNR